MFFLPTCLTAMHWRSSITLVPSPVCLADPEPFVWTQNNTAETYLPLFKRTAAMSHDLDFLENIIIYTNMCIYIYTVSLRFLCMFGKKKLLNKKRQSNNIECGHTFFCERYLCFSLDMSCTSSDTGWHYQHWLQLIRKRAFH